MFVMAHGAGAGQSHPFMVRYASGLADRGIHVVTFNFPYIDSGRRAPDRAPVLEDVFRRVVVAAAILPDVQASRLFIGGKSMGGRIATHLAAAPEAWPESAPSLGGVIVFGYPLNPPGGPSKRSPDRTSHLGRIVAPLLVVQGTRDPFGGPELIQAALQGDTPPATAATPQRHRRHVLSIAGGDHSLAAKFDQTVFDAVVDFVSAT